MVALRFKPDMWFIIWSDDSNEPSVYGSYATESEALAVAENMQKHFGSYEKKTDTQLYVTQMLEWKEDRVKPALYI